jgi:regulator of replication initiation timing
VWQRILDFARQVFTLTGDTQKNKENIKALQEENKELRRENADLRQEMNEQRLQFAEVARFCERVVFELQRTRESAEADRKLLRLEMENLLLRSGYGIPSAEPGAKPQEPREGKNKEN